MLELLPNTSEIRTNQAISIEKSQAGTIYFTIDNTQPEAVPAKEYLRPFTLPIGVSTVRARLKTTNGTLLALEEKTYSVTQQESLVLQAESATIVGSGPQVLGSGAGYTGTGYVRFENSGALEFTIPDQGGYAWVLIRSRVSSGYGEKLNNILLNGTKLGEFSTPDTGAWVDAYKSIVKFGSGTSTLKIEKNYGYFDVDSISIIPFNPTSVLAIDGTLVNPGASNGARSLYAFLKAMYGNKIISGQMDLTWDDSINMVDRVFSDTGKKPAILGFDFMNLGKSSGSGRDQTNEAIAWSKLGGIVTFCWHWRTGPQDAFYTDSGEYAAGGPKASQGTAYRIPFNTSTDTWNTATQDYSDLLYDIDLVAEELKKLKVLDIPVLWRPIHEASGAWFWWGASGPEAFIALWKLMYERLVNHHGINNLIWVWNGQADDWYPGDNWVDSIGEDIYPGPRNYATQYSRFFSASSWPKETKKIVALTENGSIPDVDLLQEGSVWWSWFMTWNDGAGAPGSTNSSNFWTGEYHNENSHKTKVYTSPYVLTLDELPNLKTYPF